MSVAVGMTVGGTAEGTRVKVGIGKVGSGVTVEVLVGVSDPATITLKETGSEAMKGVLSPPPMINAELLPEPVVLGALTVKVIVSPCPELNDTLVEQVTVDPTPAQLLKKLPPPALKVKPAPSAILKVIVPELATVPLFWTTAVTVPVFELTT